jgi:hypothetical protein
MTHASLSRYPNTSHRPSLLTNGLPPYPPPHTHIFTLSILPPLTTAAQALALVPAASRPFVPFTHTYLTPHTPSLLSPSLFSTATQALALVPAACRPFVPFRARAFCSQSQRQQVANKLLGAYLTLLLGELQVQPQQQQQVRGGD